MQKWSWSRKEKLFIRFHCLNFPQMILNFSRLWHTMWSLVSGLCCELCEKGWLFFYFMHVVMMMIWEREQKRNTSLPSAWFWRSLTMTWVKRWYFHSTTILCSNFSQPKSKLKAVSRLITITTTNLLFNFNAVISLWLLSHQENITKWLKNYVTECHENFFH